MVMGLGEEVVLFVTSASSTHHTPDAEGGEGGQKCERAEAEDDGVVECQKHRYLILLKGMHI